MTITYDVYGFKSGQLEALAETLSQVLHVNLELHESDFTGDYYRFGRRSGENFSLHSNYYDVEDVWRESELKDCEFIFYVNMTQRADEIKLLLLNNFNEQIVHLRRKLR